MPAHRGGGRGGGRGRGGSAATGRGGSATARLSSGAQSAQRSRRNAGQQPQQVEGSIPSELAAHNRSPDREMESEIDEEAKEQDLEGKYDDSNAADVQADLQQVDDRHDTAQELKEQQSSAMDDEQSSLSDAVSVNDAAEDRHNRDFDSSETGPAGSIGNQTREILKRSRSFDPDSHYASKRGRADSSRLDADLAAHMESQQLSLLNYRKKLAASHHEAALAKRQVKLLQAELLKAKTVQAELLNAKPGNAASAPESPDRVSTSATSSPSIRSSSSVSSVSTSSASSSVSQFAAHDEEEEVPVKRKRQLGKAHKNLTFPRPIVPGGTALPELASHFLARFDVYLDAENATPAERLSVIGQCLVDNAQKWYSQQKALIPKPPSFRSWSGFRKAFIAYFELPISFSTGLANLKLCAKRPNESYGAHLLRFMDELNRIPDEMTNKHTFDVYLDCLDPNVNRQVRITHANDIEQLTQNDGFTLNRLAGIAEAIDRVLARSSSTAVTASGSQVSASSWPARPPATAARPASAPATASSSLAGPTASATPYISPSYRGKHANPFHHLRNNSDSTMAKSSATAKPGTASAPQQPAQTSAASSSWTTLRRCYNCNEVGHISKDCPKPRNAKQERKEP
jgi:hypothetical protein